MDDRTLQNIMQHLQNKDAQNRILKNIERGRSEATVTIGRAASLFNFTENQLRDWEARGLVSPNKSAGGQRLYLLTELDRLAIIRELLDAKFSPGDIPTDIDQVWYTLNPLAGREVSMPVSNITGQLPIDQRVDRSEYEVFWRYFVSQVLRLSLLLICEDLPLPDNIAGIVLLLQPLTGKKINDPSDLPDASTSLVGWLSQNRAFYSFLSERPSFKYPTDFRIEHLRKVDHLNSDSFLYHPLLILQRRARNPLITPDMTQTINQLLQLVYDHRHDWRPCFEYDMRDWVYQVTDFFHIPNSTDPVLDGIMNMVVELGGKNADGSNRWYFSILFLPQDNTLPVQQQRLSARAHSKHSPLSTLSMVVSIADPGMTFRAYQSGHVLYRSSISAHDPLVAYHDSEEETRSAIAIPIGGENGMAIASLYVTSKQKEAFNDSDLRALRVITRMMEELLPTYRSRQQVPGKLSNLLNSPKDVDLAFREFLSEEDFLNDLEALLSAILKRDDIEPQDVPDLSIKSQEVVSFIEVDIDNQADLATKYSNQVARNLSKEVGLRILGHLRLQSNPLYRKVYHVNADRYYMKFEGMSLNDARDFAETLRKLLSGIYRIDARRVLLGRPLSPEHLLELPNVTVRLGVQNHYYSKLKEVILRYPADSAVTELRTTLLDNFEEALKRGQAEKGNCIISWDYEEWGYIRWAPRASI